MRIRKRWPPPPPPPPSSSLPPNKQFAPDLPTSRQQQLSSSSSSIGAATSESRRALHHHSDLSLKPNNNHCPPWETPNQLLRQSKEHDLHRSNLQLAMIRGANGWICSNGERDEVDKEKEKKNMKLKKGDCMHQCPIQIEESGAETVVIVVGVEEEEEGAKEEKKLATIHRRNKNNFGAETSLGVSISSSSSQQVGRWGEGEKVFPLKKRRGSFEGKVSDNMILEKEKKTKTKMKTKTNKKWVHAEEEEEDQESADGQTISASSVIVKKRGSGGTIMEGSRCSRVNGRGWRCCQQTLVGYSLCEHHLGKGRLRSMSSVRHRSSTIIKPKKEKEEEEEVQLSSLQSQKSLEYVEEEEEEEDEKPLLITKKRKKIGMVKARSISSLLSQTQTHAISVTSQAPADSNHSSSSNVHDM